MDDSTQIAATPGWCAHDIVAHVAAELPRYIAGIRGHAEPASDRRGVVEFNTAAVAERRSVPRGTLLEEILQGVALLVREVAERGADQPAVPFDGGALVRGDVTLALLLGEFLVHGWDLAQAASVPWRFSATEASLLLDGGAAVMPGWLTEPARHHSGVYEMRVRGGTRVRIAFGEGGVRLAAPDEPPATVTSGTPEAVVLTSYGRRSPVRFALASRLIVFGRRPWRALTLPKLIEAP